MYGGIVTRVNPLGLTERYWALVNYYFENGFNKIQAMRSVGLKSENNGYVTKLFNRPDVIAEITRRQEQMAWAHEYKAEIIVQRLIGIILANHGEIILKLRENDWDLGCLNEEELYMVNSLEEETRMVGRGGEKEETRTKRIRFKDVLKAIELLGRWQGQFTDKLQLSKEGDAIAEIYAARPDLKKLNGPKTIDHEPAEA